MRCRFPTTGSVSTYFVTHNYAMSNQRGSNATPDSQLVAALPIDDVTEGPAFAIGAQILAEEIHPTMPVIVAGTRDVRRDQHLGVRPQPRRRQVLELPDIDIERRAAQTIALQRVDECVLIDDLAARDIDQHAPRLHRGKTVLVEEPGGLRRPLAADHNEIALRQKPVEIRGAAKLGKPLRKRRAKLRALAAGAHDPHAERGAELADIEPDATGADDTGRLPVNQQRPIRPMVEGAGLAIHGGAGQILREIQNPGNRV